MKAIWLLVIFVVGSLVYGAAQQSGKLWVHEERNNSDGQSFFFIQDKETGTRCYALTNVEAAAISCVPQGVK